MSSAKWCCFVVTTCSRFRPFRFISIDVHLWSECDKQTSGVENTRSWPRLSGVNRSLPSYITGIRSSRPASSEFLAPIHTMTGTNAGPWTLGVVYFLPVDVATQASYSSLGTSYTATQLQLQGAHRRSSTFGCMPTMARDKSRQERLRLRLLRHLVVLILNSQSIRRQRGTK